MRFEKLDTKCGAPLYVLRLPHVRSLAAGVLVRTGSRDEILPKESGISHALEHMVFRGNRRFPSSREVTGFMEFVGGMVNAYTWNEMTFFHQVCPSKYAERAFEYLYHLVSTPLFRAEDIGTEMANIVQEIKEYADDPKSVSMELADELTYGAHPLGNSVIGTKETVTAFSSEDFCRYHYKWYYPENFTFIAAGDITPEDALARIDGMFVNATGRAANLRPVQFCESKTATRIIHKDIEQVHLTLASALGPAKDRSTTALRLFCQMIGGGMAFPLFQEMRERRGLCYTASASLVPWSDSGMLQLYTATEPKKAGEALAAMLDVVQSNSDNQKFFDIAREMLSGKMSVSRESAMSFLTHAAQDIIFYGSPRMPKDVVAELESIELSEVTAAVEKYLSPERLVRAVAAPNGFEL